MEQQKYVIYQNDLKYKNLRNLDKSKIDWKQNNIEHLYDINHDTLEFRLHESDNMNNTEIDLRYMDLISLPFEIKLNKFVNLSYLFLSNNNLCGEIDISVFKKLSIADLDSNQITNIILPSQLLVLSINDNKLNNITCTSCLIRLRASNNNISSIILSNNIELLELDNNKLQ